jgi:pimeloyl-ACP methyl ester carboxylesterase
MIPTPQRKRNVSVPVAGGVRQMAVHEWGDERNPRVLVCVHGLSRNGRDFDVIADALSDHYRVLCPDIPGRGESDWLASADHYQLPIYVQAIQAMLLDGGVLEHDWIGTSMGGLIGMVMASSLSAPDSRIRRFVINDIGPFIERAALERIAAYVGRPMLFPDYMTLFNTVKPINAPFGPLTDEQQHHIVRTSCMQRSDGQWEFKTDPKIGDAFRAGLQQPASDLWPLWGGIKQPTLIIRGEQSDLLSEATLERMLATHPDARALTVADTGHAPMLMDAPTISAVRDFLLAKD